MKPCALASTWLACASLPHPPRRAVSPRLCETCAYAPPAPYAAGHGAPPR
ncbi:MAG TPA: hypothetical protein VFO93_07035 [Hymenobacter sp.]|nr:hypothetical protein [Hymenobacter sp.]HET9503276.1 hypothetical protein [Hymenobacter sp.]